MSRDWVSDCLDFHRKFCPHLIGTGRPTPCDVDQFGLRWKLIKEEYDELASAITLGDLADALGDLIYVLIGMAITNGIDLRPVWDEIHRTNMAKTGGGTREDGKILKGPDWQPPDIAGVLLSQPPLTVEPSP